MVAINNSDEFRDWLENKPVEWVQVLATRIALRIFPSIADIFNQTGASQNAKEILFSSTTYALSISWVACRYSSHSIAPYATNAATYATAAAFTTTNAAPATNATYAAANAANTTFAANTTYDANATDAAAYTAKAADAANATNYAASGTWIGINADIEFLENSTDDLPTTVRNLAGKKLWLDNQHVNSTPNWASASLRNLERNLTEFDENWRVWIDWYRQILQGKPGWGLSPKNAEQLIVRIATQENEFWDQGATVVNAKIARWLANFQREGFYTDKTPLDQKNKNATPKFGGALETQQRAVIQQEIRALRQVITETQLTHGGIGHNKPPEGLELNNELVDQAGEAIQVIDTELKKTNPSVAAVTHSTDILKSIVLWAAQKANLAVDAFAKRLGSSAAIVVVGMLLPVEWKNIFLGVLTVFEASMRWLTTVISTL